MTQPQVKPQARVQIYEGMTVEAVKKNGSDGQKLMAPLFDIDQDGKYDAYEADNFDNYNFKVEKGKITMYNRNGYNGAEITELKYDDYEKDILGRNKSGMICNEHDRFNFENNKGEECYFSFGWGKAVKAVIDMVTGKVSIKGGDIGELYTSNIELTVKDADLNEISAEGGKIKLQNVKDKGLLWDSATKIETDGKTIVEADAESKFEVQAAEEE